MRYMSLCEICTPKQWPTLTLKQLSGKGFPVYGANGIIGYHDIYNHEQATVMIGCRGTCGQVTISEEKAYINGNAMCLDNLSDSYDKKFILYYLQNYDFSEIITGSSQPQITRESLKKVLIPIVSKEVQLNVVSHFDKLYELIVARRLQLAKLDQLVKSRFIELFETNPWKKVRAGTIMMNMRNGVSPSNAGTYPAKVLTLSAITQGDFDPSSWKDGMFDTDPPIEKRVTVSDFYMCRGNGNKNLVGAGAYSKEDRYDLVFPDTAIAATIDLQQVCLPYLFHAWKRPSVREQIETGARTTNGTYKINQGVVSNIELILPPLELQRQFAAFVEQTDKSKLAIQQSLDKLELLKKSLMQKYFG